MIKNVYLITGTPCIGKTSVAKQLNSRLEAFYVNLTELATTENLIQGRDEERDSIIIDEAKMTKRLSQIISETQKENVIIDGHYAVHVVLPKLVTVAFVLRRDPVELKKFMIKSGYSKKKLDENLASEILDVCLVDALNMIASQKICELDVTGKSVSKIAEEILSLIENPSSCSFGSVDWLGKLEAEGKLDEYLKI